MPRETRMAAPVSFIRWFASATLSSQFVARGKSELLRRLP
jgi:hypothetical protein